MERRLRHRWMSVLMGDVIATAMLTLILRAPMRSRSADAPSGAGAEFGVARDLVGIGEALEDSPRSPAGAILALIRTHGEKAGRMLARFADLPDVAFVWTCLRDGACRLGAIAGDWRYDDSHAARGVGVRSVGPTAWSPCRFGDGTVPDAVARMFSVRPHSLRLTATAWLRWLPRSPPVSQRPAGWQSPRHRGCSSDARPASRPPPAQRSRRARAVCRAPGHLACGQDRSRS